MCAIHAQMAHTSISIRIHVYHAQTFSLIVINVSTLNALHVMCIILFKLTATASDAIHSSQVVRIVLQIPPPVSRLSPHAQTAIPTSSTISLAHAITHPTAVNIVLLATKRSRFANTVQMASTLRLIKTRKHSYTLNSVLFVLMPSLPAVNVSFNSKMATPQTVSILYWIQHWVKVQLQQISIITSNLLQLQPITSWFAQNASQDFWSRIMTVRLNASNATKLFLAATTAAIRWASNRCITPWLNSTAHMQLNYWIWQALHHLSLPSAQLLYATPAAPPATTIRSNNSAQTAPPGAFNA